jgi:hypothetical protein
MAFGLKSVPPIISGVARKSRGMGRPALFCVMLLSTAGRRQTILSCPTLSLLI